MPSLLPRDRIFFLNLEFSNFHQFTHNHYFANIMPPISFELTPSSQISSLFDALDRSAILPLFVKAGKFTYLYCSNFPNNCSNCQNKLQGHYNLAFRIIILILDKDSMMIFKHFFLNLEFLPSVWSQLLSFKHHAPNQL